MITEAVYAKYLIKFLETEDNPHKECPQTLIPIKLMSKEQSMADECSICTGFIDLESYMCPCKQIGHKKAIKLSWEALEKGGYLNGK